MDTLPYDREGRAMLSAVALCVAEEGTAADIVALEAALKRVRGAAMERLKWDALKPSLNAMVAEWRRRFRLQEALAKTLLSGMVREGTALEPTPVWRGFLKLLAGQLTSTPEDNDAIRAAVEAASRAALASIGKGMYGVSFTMRDIGAIKWAAERAAQLVAEVNTATVAEIRSLVTQGVNQGWSYDRTAGAIIERFHSYGVERPQLHIASRAHLIAVTENAFAFERSHLAMARMLVEAGIPMVKEWGVSGDERQCSVCEGNAEQGPIPLDETFDDDSEAPPAHPACRCWMETYIDPDAEVPDVSGILGQM
jgi:hypothetical protein